MKISVFPIYSDYTVPTFAGLAISRALLVVLNNRRACPGVPHDLDSVSYQDLDHFTCSVGTLNSIGDVLQRVNSCRISFDYQHSRHITLAFHGVGGWHHGGERGACLILMNS